MNFSALVKSRLAALGYGQKDLARAVQVTDSYISQLLNRRKAPPGRDRNGIYTKMELFLQLTPGELGRLVEIERSEEIRRKLVQAPEPLYRELRDLVLRKCMPAQRDEVRIIIEGQSFGMLEQLITRKLLELARVSAGRELDNDSCLPFLDQLVASWSVDLDSFRLDVTLNGERADDTRRTFAFVEGEPGGEEPALAEFLEGPQLDGQASEDEIRLLRRHRFGERRPNKLYYYRALQNLRDPLHFREECDP